MTSGTFSPKLAWDGNLLILMIISVVTVTLIADTSIIKLSGLTFKSSSSSIIVLFAIVSVISIVGQYLILRYVKQKLQQSTITQKSLHLNVIYKIATLVHYSLAAIIVFVILQMVVTFRYDVVMLAGALNISYSFGIAMMIILGHRFFSWLKFNRSYLILLYGLSAAMIAANMGIAVVLVDSIFKDMPKEILPHLLVRTPGTLHVPGLVLNDAYVITTIVSFIITWTATMALLSYYSETIGKFKYRIILSLPLVYFVSQFLIAYLDLLAPALIADPIFYGNLFTLILSLSKPIGGIIFGIGFWIIARKISKKNVVRNFVIISGYGFVLLFTSNQAIVLTFAPYPPFGLPTITFVGLSSFLVMLGIYASAVSVSQDTKLRQEIRKLAIKESKLLDSIGSAQMEDEIRNKVIALARADETNMTSLNEEDLNHYLSEVLDEIKRRKKDKTT